MKGKSERNLSAILLLLLLAGCQSGIKNESSTNNAHPTNQGQQYRDGRLTHDFELVKEPNAQGSPMNGWDYLTQVNAIKRHAPKLFNRNNSAYQAIHQWLNAGADPKQLASFGLSAYQMEGTDGFGNVQFTGYYTPLLHARHNQQGEFKYPIYRMPAKGKGRLPSRAAIHRGAIDNRYILSYSNSLMDNFMMEVQGSGYVDLGDGQPAQFYGYAGKNGHGYYSVGKVLIDRGEVAKENMSMQAIRQWAATHSEAQVKELLEQNPSYVFFQPKVAAPVKGASGVPLVARAAVAADKILIPAGSTLLAEVPLLDSQGKFTGKYQIRLMVALDVGGAIKGHHFDIYQGIGDKAGELAGFYNHYGRVWLLTPAAGGAPQFTVYNPR